MTKVVKKDLQACLNKEFSSMTDEEKAQAIKSMGFTTKLSHLKDVKVDYEDIAFGVVLSGMSKEPWNLDVSGDVVEAAEAKLAEVLGMSKEEAEQALKDNDVFFRKHLEEVGIAALKHLQLIGDKLNSHEGDAQ